MKGTYVLLIELPQPQEIAVGKLGLLAFPQGFYAYVGSAMNGFESRISYHLREKKKSRWHIDYLLQQALIKEIILWETEERVECILAQTLSREFHTVTGFGASDCRCSSHLYFEAEKGKLGKGIMEAVKSLAI
jgi:Uri superfamily endonuclease